MCGCSGTTVPSRLASEGQQLVVHKFLDGSLGLALIADVRLNQSRLEQTQRFSFWSRLLRRFQSAPQISKPIPAVSVPTGAHVILKGISGSLQQKYGLEEREGAVFLQGTDETNQYPVLRFNNGAEIRLPELRAGHSIEVLSLAGTHPILYEPQFQER